MKTAMSDKIARHAEETRQRLEASPEGRRIIREQQEAKERVIIEAQETAKKAQTLKLTNMYNNCAELLRNYGLGVDVIAYASKDMRPITHKHTGRFAYKIAIPPATEKTLLLGAQWTVLPLDTSNIRGYTAYCDNSLKEGQKIRVISIHDKSCVIQPIIDLTPKSE